MADRLTQLEDRFTRLSSRASKLLYKIRSGEVTEAQYHKAQRASDRARFALEKEFDKRRPKQGRALTPAERRQGYNPRRRNPGVVVQPSPRKKGVWWIGAVGGSADWWTAKTRAGAIKKGQRMAAQIARDNRLPVSAVPVTVREPQANPPRRNQSLALVQAADGAGRATGRDWPGTKQPAITPVDREFRNWLTYRSGSMPEIQTLTAAQKKQVRFAFVRGVRAGFATKNPANLRRVKITSKWKPAHVRKDSRGKLHIDLVDTNRNPAPFAACVKAVKRSGSAYDPGAVCAASERKRGLMNGRRRR